MTYDEGLAHRIRDELAAEPDMTERKMFGGLGFMVDGHLAVAAGSGGDLMVRVSQEDAETWIDDDAVRAMEMRGRPVRGWLLVAVDAVGDAEALRVWVERGVACARSLPAR